MLKILEILEERNNSLDIREWKIPTFSNGGGWGLINDVLSNSPLFCGIGGPGKNSSYTGVVLSIRGTSLAPSRFQVKCLELSILNGSCMYLGTIGFSNLDEFSEEKNSKRPPPVLVSKNYVALNDIRKGPRIRIFQNHSQRANM